VETENARRQGAEEIITVLAHDLRNHLQPLLARLQVMRVRLEKGGHVTPNDVERALQSMQRLSGLTEDLLDLKRLEEGLFGLKLAPVDFAAIASETAVYLGTSAAPVRVTGEQKVVGIADGARVRQALENLVANAVKYSPSGKPVEVHVSCEARDGRDWAALDVLDVGPGIAPELASTLFDRFAYTPDSKGLGLGLPLAYGIARVHGGELSVHPRPAGGTRFRLSLPLEPLEDPASTRPH
jgi:signal transduction histidine kinase